MKPALIYIHYTVKLHVPSSAVLKCEYKDREIGNVNAIANAINF